MPSSAVSAAGSLKWPQECSQRTWQLTSAHRPGPRAAGSLQGITDKLRLLHTMMHTPEPGTQQTEEPPKYTPLDRLKLLREVAEDARVFRLGGEDKIRVATNTCETVRCRR